MTEVKFRLYRQYLDQRQQVNSSVMALLAGSQLASHTLQLTAGSNRTLREIFPRVPHIDRFNLKSETAREYLGDAEAHLSAMAIPYIITIQESLFGTFEDMLCAAGKLAARPPKAMKSPVWVVKEYWESIGQTLDKTSWQVFELLNELRHDITHRAGVAGTALISKATAIDPQAKALWAHMASKPFPTFVLDQRHDLDHADMVVALAVVKFLADEGNTIMQSCYPRSMWLADLVADLNEDGVLTGNRRKKIKHAAFHARTKYASLGFTQEELEAEIIRQK